MAILYIVATSCANQDRSSNPRDFYGNTCILFKLDGKIGIFHQISQQLLQWTDLHQTISVSSHIYGDYKTDISFAVAQGMVLW